MTGTLINDINPPMSTDIERKLRLEKYKDNPTSPELLTQFMRSFWQDAGQRIGKSYVVDEFPLTAMEIRESQKAGYMAIYVPNGVSIKDLGRMFPDMSSWSVEGDDSVVDVVNNFGWLWIEASIDTPNRGTTQIILEQKFKREQKQGQSLRTYVVGRQICKLLTGRYFDEGGNSSRLLGSYFGDRALCGSSSPSGNRNIEAFLDPLYQSEYLGGRSEELIKT